MKLLRFFVFAAFGALVSVCAQAQVTFTNNDGTFTFFNATTGPNAQQLDLGVTTGNGVFGLPNPGELTAIGGLSSFGIPDNAVPFPSCSPSCLGTITLQTGTLASGTILTSATFNPGGTFNVSYTSGVSFTGTFTSASWIKIGAGTWTFSGTIMGGTLMIGSNMYTIPDAATVQLTTTNAGATLHTAKNVYTFSDNGGTTNFMAPTVAPEPGTLSLFGSGLVVAGLVVRRRFSGRPSKT